MKNRFLVAAYLLACAARPAKAQDSLPGLPSQRTRLITVFQVQDTARRGDVLWDSGPLDPEPAEFDRVVFHGYSLDARITFLASVAAALFLRAYSMGAGTYTGIEAVSNGLQIMREPKVETAKRTMIYMASSLAVAAGGITLCYLLLHTAPVSGKTMNAVLAEQFTGLFGQPAGQLSRWFVGLTLFSEAALLFVAAQTGFIGAPRVMANMANDSWLPRRFASLSDRLTMQDGVLLTSAASMLTLFYTRGHTETLVLMYSINVFLTFSLSQLGMVRYWVRNRSSYPTWSRQIWVPIIGAILCLWILAVSVYEKFTEGGWVTLALTTLLMALCQQIRRHYGRVKDNLSRLDEIANAFPMESGGEPKKLDPKTPTAVLLVGSYGGLGIHSILSIQRVFPKHFENFMFVSVGVIDAAAFKGVREVEEMRRHTEHFLRRYVDLARRMGLAADYRFDMGTEVTDEAERLCLDICKEFPRSVIFASKLVFEHEHWYQRLLHNETAYQIQRRLQFSGLNAMVLPVRVLAGQPVPATA